MKIVSWNVNGLRAVLKNRGTNLREFLDSFSADVICLQEVKCSRSQIGHDVAICDGYNAFFSFCRTKQGYSGVVTYTKNSCMPTAAEEGITGSGVSERSDSVVGSPAHLPHLSAQELTGLDVEGRAVLTQHSCAGGRSVVIVNVYCPRVDPDMPERLTYKLNFFTALRERCSALISNGRDVIVVGDLNCVLFDADSAVLEEMHTFPIQSEARQLLRSFVSMASSSDSGHILIDSFRQLYPDRKGAYTCWCTKTDSRKLNYGQRIDFILLSPGLVNVLSDSQVLQEEFGSDHCPVLAELSLVPSPASSPPLHSTTHYPEFAGKQSKLSSFFTTTSTSKSAQSQSHRKRPQTQNQSITAFLLPSAKKTRDKTSASTSSTPASSAKLGSHWKDVFKGPPKAPLCSGHQEPSVERVVKKSGPNRGKHFYVCARPEGAKNDPASRCDFFKWSSTKN